VTAGPSGSGPGALARLLGIRPVSMGDGRARFELTVREDHLNPNGVVHGGIVYSLADTAMGAALFSALDPGQSCTTLEIKINYLAPVTSGELAAEASVIGRTKRTGVLEARVHGDGGALVAVATGTFYIQQAG
jgi:acyl-CoA thioesterase